MFDLPHHGMNGVVILSAFLLDIAFGDPRWFPHPVRGIGWMIQKAEAVLMRFAHTAKAEKIAGVVLVILIIFPVYFISRFLILTAFAISLYLGFIFSALVAYTALATRGLAGAAREVLSHLEADDIARARTELSMIVGRDTANLDEREIVRAVIETVAENASDGVIAPLFYLAIGGPALALAYKAVNTLDSMVGYKNEKYINLGCASAKLDDVANYIPARITAVLICMASNGALLFKSAIRNPKSEIISPWRIMLRDGRSHPSPNSGYPEAAMAGALGIRLGGPSAYAGRPSIKSYIGEPQNPVVKKYIEKSVRLMYCATLLAALGAAAIPLLL